MAETPEDPLLPDAAPGPLDVTGLPAAAAEAPPLPFVPPAMDAASSVAPPASLIPESVRKRAAEDLPFALGPGGIVAPTSARDDDTEGVPTGLPDLRALAGIEVEEAPKAAPAPTSPLAQELDDGLMALPSPSMIEPSPFAEEESEDSEPDEVVLGHVPMPPPGSPFYNDDTEQEQLPPTPIGMMRRDSADVVPARVLMEAMAESEHRHMVHLALAFSLGAFSSVGGFVAARWALMTFG